MGLDMFLQARNNKKNVAVVEVGYWRKANQIHQWFVQNVQNGVDECEKHSVTKEQLLELREACSAVLMDKDKAAYILPTQGGFFFGSTDYDEWYLGDLEETIKIIDRATALIDEGWDITYQSSW